MSSRSRRRRSNINNNIVDLNKIKSFPTGYQYLRLQYKKKIESKVYLTCYNGVLDKQRRNHYKHMKKHALFWGTGYPKDVVITKEKQKKKIKHQLQQKNHEEMNQCKNHHFKKYDVIF